MIKEKKPLKVKFTKSFFESLKDMTSTMDKKEIAGLEEAIQEALQQINKAAADGTIEEIGEPVNMEKLRIEEPELYEHLINIDKEEAEKN